MYTKILVLVAVVAAVAAYPGHHDEHIVDYHAPANYEFKYGVSDHHTGDEKEQSEVRHGDVVKGHYSLKEADGTIRIVKYTADKHNGFNAIVERKGHAIHPEIVHKSVPIIAHAAPIIAHAAPIYSHAAPIIAHAAPISFGHGGFDLGGHGHGGEAISFSSGHLGYGGHHY